MNNNKFSWQCCHLCWESTNQVMRDWSNMSSNQQVHLLDTNQTSMVPVHWVHLINVGGTTMVSSLQGHLAIVSGAIHISVAITICPTQVIASGVTRAILAGPLQVSVTIMKETSNAERFVYVRRNHVRRRLLVILCPRRVNSTVCRGW